MYYGLFIRVGHKLVRVDRTTGFTLETAKKEFANLVTQLMEKGFTPLFRPLRPVKLIDIRTADRKYAKSLW